MLASALKNSVNIPIEDVAMLHSPLGLKSLSNKLIFVTASHQTELDTRSMTRRSIIVGVKGRRRLGMSRGPSSAGL